mgnify:CR=1 FL=1
MKLISWNVNGLRACVDKGFMDFFKEADADVFCIQESKLQAGQIDLPLEGYHQYWNYAEKKGYSGTALFTKQKPLSVTYGIGIPEHDKEGRVITAEFADFYVVTVYTPNSQRELTRLSYRMEWEAAFLAYINGLNEKMIAIVNESIASGEDIESREAEIKEIADTIEVLKRRIQIITENSMKNAEYADRIAEIERIITERASHQNEYDDSIVRQMVECIKVYADKHIEVIFGGGYAVEETVE